MIRSI